MAEVVIHIGTHKTGTTTIQDTFWHNAERLAQHGIAYPQLSRITGHHGLVCDWVRLPPAFQLPEGSRAQLRRLARDHVDSDATLFLSSEEFSRSEPGNCVDLAELRSFFAGFDRVRVLCVLRTQWEFLQSVYLEVSKVGNPPKPETFVQSAIETGMVQGLWADYTGLLDRLEAAFAPQDITLLDYRQASAGEGGLIGAMLAALGSDLRAEALEPVNGGFSNSSPMPLASYMANSLAAPRRASRGLVEMAQRVLQRTNGDIPIRSSIFVRQEFDALAAHFEACNARLAQRRAEVQPGFHLAAADPSDITHFRDSLRAFTWFQFAKELAEHAQLD